MTRGRAAGLALELVGASFLTLLVGSSILSFAPNVPPSEVLSETEAAFRCSAGSSTSDRLAALDDSARNCSMSSSVAVDSPVVTFSTGAGASGDDSDASGSTDASGSFALNSLSWVGASSNVTSDDELRKSA